MWLLFYVMAKKMYFPKFTSSDDGENCHKGLRDFRHDRLKKVFRVIRMFHPGIASRIVEMEDHKGNLHVYFSGKTFSHTSEHYLVHAWNLANEHNVFLHSIDQEK